jgi:hypothetical protein
MEHADEQPQPAIVRRFRNRRLAEEDRARGLAAPRQVDRFARLGEDRRNECALCLAAIGLGAPPNGTPRASGDRHPRATNVTDALWARGPEAP